MGQCIAHQMREEDAVGARLLQRIVHQGVEQSRLAPDGSHVEHDAGQHLRHGRRFSDPAVEIALPGLQRLAPLVIGRHHVAWAVDVAAGVETVADEPSQSLEVVAVLLCVVAVIQDQAIVLVRDAGLLAARLRAASQPEIGDRRLAKPRLRELKEALGRGIADAGDNVADVVRRAACIHQGDKKLRNLRDDLRQVLRCIVLVDLADQDDGRLRLLAHQIGAGDDACQPPLLNDWPSD